MNVENRMLVYVQVRLYQYHSEKIHMKDIENYIQYCQLLNKK